MIEMKETSAISWSEHLVLQVEKQAQRYEVTYPSHSGNPGLLLLLSLILNSAWMLVGFSGS